MDALCKCMLIKDNSCAVISAVLACKIREAT